MTTIVRKTISLQSDINTKGVRNARLRGFRSSFSAYAAHLIDLDDIAERDLHSAAHADRRAAGHQHSQGGARHGA